MQIGMVGLGRMRANVVRRLIRGGPGCVVFNKSPKAVQELADEIAVGSKGLRDLVDKLPVLSIELYEHFSSRREADYQDKLLSAMRYQFGGHVEKPGGKQAA